MNEWLPDDPYPVADVEDWPDTDDLADAVDAVDAGNALDAGDAADGSAGDDEGPLDAAALSIVYGQRHGIELEAARRVAQQQGVDEHVVLPLDLRVFGASALTDEIDVPKDFAVGFGNEVEEQAKSFRELQLVLILAIILVYTVMA